MDTEKLAKHIYDWLTEQRYGEESILHAAVICDFVGAIHFEQAIKRQIDTFLAQNET